MSLAAVGVLWQRDMKRFLRQKSRIVGALGQPILFWLVIGFGLNAAFELPGGDGLEYRSYFYPGVIVMVVLFTSIFSTISIIEDRHAGFLQAVLVAPASRTALVMGKVLGGATVALVQAALFLVVAPLAGFPFAKVDWGMLVLLLLLLSVGLTGLGFFLAWFLDSTQGFHAVMSVFLIPMWILSGAMFPVAGDSRVLTAMMRWNPLTYGVEGVHRALRGGGVLPAGVGVEGTTAGFDLAVVAGLAGVAMGLAVWACRRRA